MVTTFDPRIHFALVCAANSCPPIAFYNGEQLDQQLDLAMRSFLSGGGLHVERDSGTLFLSRIFKWYLGDFGGKTGLLNWLLPLLEDGPVKGETWKIRYIPYGWGLNQVV